MAANIALLPTELHYMIMSYLDTRNILSLALCCARLHKTVEGYLFRIHMYRDMAMGHAIKSLNLPMMKRLLIIHNASPTVVYLPCHGSDSILLPEEVIESIPALSLDPCQDYIECFCFGHLALGLLAKIDTATLDAADKTAAYFEAWQLLLAHGARLADPDLAPLILRAPVAYAPQVPSGDPGQNEVEEYTKVYFRQKTCALLRHLVTKPASTPQQAAIKVWLITIYYDVLRDMAVADAGLSRASIFLEIPRLIRVGSAYDDIVIAEILDREGIRAAPVEPNDQVSPPPPGTPQKRTSIPLVDRPVKVGPGGEFLSPLSSAILKNNRRVFDLLLKRGARINGVDLDFKRYGPTRHSLHIPIFAAAWLAARDFATGLPWIKTCLEQGADANHLSMGSLCFMTPGYIQKHVDGYFHWITPLDVYLSAIPRRVIRKIIPKDQELSEVDKLEQLLLEGFKIDHAFKQPLDIQLPPPEERVDDRPITARHVCRNAADGQKGHHACGWCGLRKCRAPSSVELILDRLSCKQSLSSAGYRLAKHLMLTHRSGRETMAKLFVRYDAHMADAVFSNAAGRNLGWTTPVARLFQESLEQSGWTIQRFNKEVGLYLVYRALHDGGNCETATAILQQYRQAATVLHARQQDDADDDAEERMYLYAIEGDRELIDFNTLYAPDDDHALLLFDDYRLRVCGQAPDLFNGRPVLGWTVLHELCRLWNMQRKIVEHMSDVTGQIHDINEYLRRIDASSRMKLLLYLFDRGVEAIFIDANEHTAMDVLVMDATQTQTEGGTLALKSQADFMWAAWRCYQFEHTKTPIMHPGVEADDME